MAYLDGHVNLEAQDLSAEDAPTLDRVLRLADCMADPHRAQPVIQVTGTNGKGSTTAVITALLMAHDVSVGAYTSPDLGRVNERIACNGEPIGDDELSEALESIEELEKRRGDEEVTLAWVADRLQEFTDTHPEFETAVERLATWLARLDDPDD